MVKRKIKNKSWLIVIGSLLLFVGISFILYDYISNKHIGNMEEQAIENFYNEDIIIEEESNDNTQEKEEVKEQIKVNYIAVLKIPKINLERGLVDPSSYLNSVKYNVEIVKGSSMPDEINGNVILASHSGNSRVSYFRNLDKLSIGDDVSIDYNSKSYNYKIVDIYDIDKTGQVEIIRNKNKNTLTLITCRHNTQKQIVVICELKS